MTTKTIDPDLLIAEVRRQAQLQPDKIYRTYFPILDEDGDDACRYVYEGKPSCIVGWAAMELGWITKAFEETDANVGPTEALFYALGAPAHLFDERKIMWLEKVQQLQDGGYTWSSAVSVADRDIEL